MYKQTSMFTISLRYYFIAQLLLPINCTECDPGVKVAIFKYSNSYS